LIKQSITRFPTGTSKIVINRGVVKLTSVDSLQLTVPIPGFQDWQYASAKASEYAVCFRIFTHTSGNARKRDYLLMIFNSFSVVPLGIRNVDFPIKA
jgi:hypothetical protein